MRQYEQSGRCKVKLESRSGAIGVRNSLVCTAAINSSVSCSASNVASTLDAMISTVLTQVADRPRYRVMQSHIFSATTFKT